MFKTLKQALWGALFGCLIATQALGQATLLPNAKQQFFTPQGIPAASGTVDFYIPSTTTRKTTWNSSTESVGTQNPNPVLLDAGGFAKIYGDGAYRQVVKDVDGNTIWDAVTASTGGGSTPVTPVAGDGAYVGTMMMWSGLVPPVNYVFAYGQELTRAGYPLFLSTITLTTNLICTSGLNVLSGITDTKQIRFGAPVEASCIPPGTTVTSVSTNSVTVSANASISTAIAATFFPWGNGDGSTTFNVPDLRGRVLAGRNNMGGAGSTALTSNFYGTSPDALGAPGGGQSHALTLAELPTGIASSNSSGSIPVAVISTTPLTATGTIQSANVTGGADRAFTSNAVNQVINSSGNLAINAVGVLSTNTGGQPHALIQPTTTANIIIKVLPDVSVSSINNLNVGLTQINNGANGYVLADFAGILGQYATGMSGHAIPFLDGTNTWSNLNTCSANCGLVLSGNSIVQASTYGYFDSNALAQSVFSNTAVSNTHAEANSVWNMTSNTGAGTGTAAYKSNILTAISASLGSAPVWSAAFVGTALPGFLGQVIVTENDLNVFSQIYSSPTGPYTANLFLSGLNDDGAGHTGRATAGIVISASQNANPQWTYGIICGTPSFTVFATSCFFDQSNTPTSILLAGTHTYGMDTTAGTYSGAAIRTGLIRMEGATGGSQYLDRIDSSNWFQSASGGKFRIASALFGIAISADYTTGLVQFPSLTTAGVVTTDASGNIFSAATTGTGNYVRATSPTIASPTITGAFTATGLVTNADLVNASITVGGATCTLGGSCSPTAGAIAVGDTVTGGTNNGVFFNSAGTFGNTAAGTNGQLFLGVTSGNPLFATMSGDATITNAGVLTLASTISAGGPTGSATVAPIITYDAKGRLTAVSSATITPAIGSITGLGTGIATWLTTPSSANLATAVTDETGSGALVFGTSPTLATPVINGLPTGTGVATANTASTLVARDSSGNFAAGTITAALSGNATTATTATNATNTAITDDTSTNAAMNLTWVTSNTGNLPQKVTSTKLNFNPSTGALSSTSFTGAGTGLTGTAASLTAGSVTTNANLTGDVTSSGNATTLTNAPVIAKVLTGFSSGAGTVSSSDSILSAFQKIDGNVALKAPLASPSLTGLAAISNTSSGLIEYLRLASTAANATNDGQRISWYDTPDAVAIGAIDHIKTGTGLYEMRFLSWNGSSNAQWMSVNTSGRVAITGDLSVSAITQTAVAQSGTVCYNSGTGLITYDATLGCLASTLDVKDDWTDLSPEQCLSKVLAMRAGSFTYKSGMGLPKGEQIGLNAQQIAMIDERLVARDKDGKLLGVRYQQASALYACAIQAVVESRK